MANKEMTRKQALSIAIREMEDDNRPEVVEALGIVRKMLAQLEKPRAKTDIVNKVQAANDAEARALYEVAPEQFAGEFVMAHTSAITPQKVVAIMKRGIALGLFEKVTDGKRVAYRKVG